MAVKRSTSWSGLWGLRSPIWSNRCAGRPDLELHDENGALIQDNDNWKDTQQTEIEATGLQPTNDLESAIFQTLAPGAYTAIVAGKDDTTGVGLVEVYRLPERARAR